MAGSSLNPWMHGRFQVFSLMWVFGPWSPGRSHCPPTPGGSLEPIWFGKPYKIVQLVNLLYIMCHWKWLKNVPYMFFISIQAQFEPYRFPQSSKLDKEMKNHHWQNAVPGSDTAQLKSISWKSMVTPIEAGIVIYQWTDTRYIYI